MTNGNLKMFESHGGIWDDEQKVLEICSPHLLVQIAGYVKYKSGGINATVHFRGQDQKYDTLKATLHRLKGNHTIAAIHRRQGKLNEFVKRVIEDEAILNGTPKAVIEPILQQYGLRTRWIDFVDNIWIALWFACNRYYISGKDKNYAHFERRPVGNNKSYAYISIACIQNLEPVSNSSGFFRSDSYDLCDLRVASPSMYLRPHAQYGIMIRKRNISNVKDTDCSNCIFGTIRIPLGDALAWLGSGELLSTHMLFPPPYYDQGYRLLLEKIIPGNDDVGSICYVSP